MIMGASGYLGIQNALFGSKQEIMGLDMSIGWDIIRKGDQNGVLR